MKKYSFVFLFLLVSCFSVPFTGRKQLKFIPNTPLFLLSSIQYSIVLKTSKLELSTPRSMKIKLIGEKLQKALERYLSERSMSSALKGYSWEFNLIDSSELNAWCMPGGKVAFFTQILSVCKDDDGIATIMGHEIAHAVANHAAERLSYDALVEGGNALGEELLKEKWMSFFGRLYNPIAGLTLLKYSRDQEDEADKIGLYIMAMAGYDPRKAPDLWKRMLKENKGKLAFPEFLSTHPNIENRIKNIHKEIPQALKYYIHPDKF